MTTKQRKILRDGLEQTIDEWIQAAQDSDTPFDCWIGDETAALMTDAAFAVIEAVDDAQRYLEREGHLKKF